MLNLSKEAARTLERLWPRVAPLIPDDSERALFRARLEAYFPDLFRLLVDLYADRYDFFFHLEQMLCTTATSYAQRAPDLKEFDQQRETDPQWFQSERMLGGIIYVDLFSGDLAGVQAKIPYFKELGLTYLHLMPLFRTPEGHNDGGYAISSYRDVDPALGTTDELAELAAALRAEGISLCLDFVFNHTSSEHTWALNALAGDEDFQAYYWMFPDRTLPDQYEAHLREIFPEQAPGSFTYRPEIDRWVWTTFHNFQWDLNYSNPAVFTAMLGELLFLANVGCEVLRLDAVAFIWKQLGTMCEGLPPVHTIIRAFNAWVRIAAPAMVFKSEAIVHPAEVASYISPEEAPVSYNPTLMALLWDALATRDTSLLRLSMQNRFELPEGCAWVNYIRCHDDIGWTFADEDARELGINGFDHRQFLNQFYTGQFPGSFARGVPFNFNPITRDMRISGMAASLAGLEQAHTQDNALYREHALRRLELLVSIIMSVGGIPLLYLGDEIAMTNDYGYREHPSRHDDSRWVHRLRFDWECAAARHDPVTDAGRIFTTVKRLAALRQETPALRNGTTHFLTLPNQHVFGYVRNGVVLVLANFSEQAQTVHLSWLPPNATDLLSGATFPAYQPLTLEPYRFVWLASG